MDSFWSALLGALIGVAASLGAVGFSFYLTQRAQRVERVDSATALVMTALADFATARQTQVAWSRYGIYKNNPAPTQPPSSAVTIAIEQLTMATVKDERKVVRRIAAAWLAIDNYRASAGSNSSDVKALNHLASAITAWRTGEASGDELEARIQTAEMFLHDKPNS